MSKYTKRVDFFKDFCLYFVELTYRFQCFLVQISIQYYGLPVFDVLRLDSEITNWLEHGDAYVQVDKYEEI